MKSNPKSTTNADLENEAIFQKRIQDLILDLAEAESRVHNMRFVDKRLKRKFTIHIESFIRKNQTLYKVALKVKNLL